MLDYGMFYGILTYSIAVCYNDLAFRGRHPSQQTAYAIIDIKGMTPMTKNIEVVDASGKIYEATYPKRARQLVKNGRARFISESRICLACPPEITEEITMTDATKTTRLTKQEYLDYMLKQMAEIQEDNAHILTALAQLATMEINPGTPDSRAMAMGNIIEARESTNRKLLAMYQDIYNDLK